MYQQGKPDGLIIGNNAGGLFLQQIMGAKGIEIDGASSTAIKVRQIFAWRPKAVSWREAV